MLQSQIIWPSEALRPFVHHYWSMRTDSHTMEMNIMPMGCMKWMFHRGRPFSVNGILDLSSTASICGQYHSAIHVGINGYTDLLFVFFQPYAMKMITGIPCNEFCNTNVNMDDLEIPEFEQLKQMILDTEDNITAIRLIERFIARQLNIRGDDIYLKRFMSVCHTIECCPDISLTTLADRACLSERQLRRIFIEHVGLPPKQMLRIRRCLASSKSILQLAGKDLTPIIDRFGFTDHSHLYKEFKLFAGMSPSEYLNHVEAIRNHHLMTGYQAYHG